MVLLIVYVGIALGFSFLCSIAEAVILSVTPAFISLLEQQGRPKAAKLLNKLKKDINTPLAAILTLNTIAHTAGAAGAGAQAAYILGDQFVGIISAVLTILILVFSEIIPKTLGAFYWRGLAPTTAVFLKYLIIIFYPFVKLSALLTRHLAHGPSLKGFNRDEFAAMAELSGREGQLEQQELTIIMNLLQFSTVRVREITTPRTVVFQVSSDLTVGEFFSQYEQERFSRIPVYKGTRENIVGFILRSDLLLSQARNEIDRSISEFMRPIHGVPESLNLSQVFELFLTKRYQIISVIDEHGGFEGIITLEDIFESLIGQDIIDESDRAPNMQRLAMNRWQLKIKKMARKKERKEKKDRKVKTS